jgi:hypothetical protein
MMRAALAALALAVAAPARAETRPQLKLTLTREPPPRHLRMRPRTAAAPAPTPPPPRAAPPMPAAPPQLSQLDASSDELAALRDVREPVSFSLTIGYQVDGARPSGNNSLDAPVQAGRDYAALRSYGFGELFFSTRGVALDSLSSYFSLRLDAAQRATVRAPEGDAVRLAPPIATWFERNTFEVRTGWGEVKDFLPRNLGLNKLRLRAGSQYIYGPWVLHIDGALLAYDGDVVTASAYAGGRHADYTVDLANERYAVAGASARVDLRPLVALPIALTGETLAVQSFVAGQPDSSHRQLQIDWQPRRDFTMFAQLRTLDDRIANQRVQLRLRYREVTNVVLDVMRRLDSDWRWDPSLIAADDPTAARRYLDLGPVLPQVIASLRGGTLIAENVDLFARTTVAVDRTKTGAPRSSFSAAYFEAGGALELRLRRTVAVGASLLSRQTQREDEVAGSIIDVPGTPDPLAASSTTGEKGFTEIGGRVRMSLGARRFSTMVEVYGRRMRYAESYRDPSDPIETRDLRGGGRVTVDAWIGKRLRLFASYDLSTAIEFSPEITSYRSLRLTMTGVY